MQLDADKYGSRRVNEPIPSRIWRPAPATAALSHPPAAARAHRGRFRGRPHVASDDLPPQHRATDATRSAAPLGAALPCQVLLQLPHFVAEPVTPFFSTAVILLLLLPSSSSLFPLPGSCPSFGCCAPILYGPPHEHSHAQCGRRPPLPFSPAVLCPRGRRLGVTPPSLTAVAVRHGARPLPPLPPPRQSRL